MTDKDATKVDVEADDGAQLTVEAAPASGKLTVYGTSIPWWALAAGILGLVAVRYMLNREKA